MADEDLLGKKHKGDQFPAAKTPAMAKQDAATQAKFNDPKAVPIEVYFQLRGISRVEDRAARQRFTKVRSATMEKWDEIFKKF